MKCTNCGREPRNYETNAAKMGQPSQFPAIVNKGGRQYHLEGFRVEGDSVESAVITCAECCEKSGVTVVNKLVVAAPVLKKGKKK